MMTIDRNIIDSAFADYTKAYDFSNKRVALKIYHTSRVAKVTDRITAGLDMNQDDQDLAWAIGMLHDIGRFEQVTRYGTFMDAKSVDHAEFGADLLFKEGLINKFGGSFMTEEEITIIETAIRQHNKYRIDRSLDERLAKFCNIIRDADKVDIMRVNVETPRSVIYGYSEDELELSQVTDKVFETFMEGKCVDRNTRITPVDGLVNHISFAFELVYEESRRIAVEEGHILKLLEFKSRNPESNKKFEIMRRRMLEYLNVEV